MTRLAELATRHPRRVLAATAVFFLIAAVFGGPVFGLLKAGNDFEDPSSQSAKARDQIQRAAGTQVDVGLVAVVRLGVPVSSPSAATEVTGIVRALLVRRSWHGSANATGGRPLRSDASTPGSASAKHPQPRQETHDLPASANPEPGP